MVSVEGSSVARISSFVCCFALFAGDAGASSSLNLKYVTTEVKDAVTCYNT